MQYNQDKVEKQINIELTIKFKHKISDLFRDLYSKRITPENFNITDLNAIKI